MQTTAGTPHVVIVGGGFGGLTAARALARENVAITLIDRQNHHVFQPLLYEVATAGFSSTTIAEPLRGILASQRNVTVLMDNVDGIDVGAREVRCADARIAYDYLIVAAGAGQSYFGHDEWAAHAPPLKTVDDALSMRARLLGAFEEAERGATAEAPTFVVVGAGATGVELAGHIAELARATLARDFRRIAPRRARVVLVEGGPRVLPGMSERASDSARRQLERLGVQVMTSATVCHVDSDHVRLASGERIATRFVAWAAGVAASPLGRHLDAPLDRGGKVQVAPDLSLPGHPEVFVVGDLAACTGPDGGAVPGVAPAAKQMGRYAARVIRARTGGAPPPGPFRYRDDGALATIGRNAAVVQLRAGLFSGRAAWLFWLFVHVLFLRGARRRFAATSSWIWRLLSGQRAARVIVRSAPAAAVSPAAAPPA